MKNSYAISKIKAREILDSRGNPTVEVDVITESGDVGRAAVPSGASTGRYEALELRDGGKRYHGKGVLKAVKNVNEIIAPALKGLDVRSQEEIDKKMIELDGTPNKSKLGANAILAVSLATARAAANVLKIPLYKHLSKDKDELLLPVPLMNIINGGKHAGNKLNIQEFMIIPHGGKTFKESLRMGAEIYHTLKRILEKKYGKNATNIGDEGGYAPPMEQTTEALEALIRSMEEAGYVPKKEVSLGVDAAASEFYNEEHGKYYLDQRSLTADELIEYYTQLIETYPIASIEDPFQEEDFETFAEFTKKLGSKIQIVGDDLFVTNTRRLEKGIQMGAANALLLKVNQIGTLTEALEAAKTAFQHDYAVIVSHRSGETEDPFIADLAVALCTGQIKTGAPARSDRTSKYNQLLRIEEELGEKAKFPANEFRTFWKKYR
ncbi:MAG: phosphopyruvate hydratase [Candidatus Baldrarchaeia archaeon]